MNELDNLLPAIPLLEGQPAWVQALAGLVTMVLLAYLVRLLVHVVLVRGVGRWSHPAQPRWMNVLLHPKVLGRLERIAPSLFIQLTVGAVPHLPAAATTVIRNVALAVTLLHVARLLMTLLDSFEEDHERAAALAARTSTRSIKSYVQLAKLAVALLGTIVIIAALLDRSPLILLSGLGAMSAVLLLVFKDTLLSFTAGLQLASNDMLRVGDWIEMPQVGADGFVIDIALHTVKVQNWDKTITTIPTWRLMAESYRNWRGMFSSGGRRIKRSLLIDMNSVRFLEPEDIDNLRSIALIRPYMEDKLRSVAETNSALAAQLGELAKDPANQRRLTNLGTFRAYVSEYLKRHPAIHQDMILMVRTMEPTSQGIPLELYCFTATTAWVEYEAAQSDIFDHLLAILPEFGLRPYQQPSGHDLQVGLAQIRGEAPPGLNRPAAGG